MGLIESAWPAGAVPARWRCPIAWPPILDWLAVRASARRAMRFSPCRAERMNATAAPSRWRAANWTIEARVQGVFVARFAFAIVANAGGHALPREVGGRTRTRSLSTMPAARARLARGCAKGGVWVSECFGCVGAQFAARRSARMSAQDRSRTRGNSTRIRTCPRDYRIGGRKDGVAATLTNAVALLLGCWS